VKPRLMDMTRGEVEAAGERDHYRRLNEYEREQDIAQAREEWLESLEPEDEAA
jgi:hypothetical protein